MYHHRRCCKWLPPASIHSCAHLIILSYTRCNIVILMAATAWLMSFSSCIVCGFDSCTVLFKCLPRKFLPLGGGERERENFSLRTVEKYGIRIKSAHDTGTEGHQPRSCSHQNHYVTSGVSQHDDSTTVDSCSNTLRNIHTNGRENITRTRTKRKAGYFFVAHPILAVLILL